MKLLEFQVLAYICVLFSKKKIEKVNCQARASNLIINKLQQLSWLVVTIVKKIHLFISKSILYLNIFPAYFLRICHISRKHSCFLSYFRNISAKKTIQQTDYQLIKVCQFNYLLQFYIRKQQRKSSYMNQLFPVIQNHHNSFALI